MSPTHFLLIASVLLPACAAQPGPAPRNGPLEALVQGARADAAQRSGLAPAQLTLVSAQPVNWPDGSVGCPQPGRLYTQALVPGYRVQLQVRDQVWSYHAGTIGPPVLCPPERAQAPVADPRV